jgi:hypothetical protein
MYISIKYNKDGVASIKPAHLYSTVYGRSQHQYARHVR